MEATKLDAIRHYVETNREDPAQLGTLGFGLFAHKEPPKSSKFVALYNDGSGADIFMRFDDGDYCDEHLTPVDEAIFDDFLYWIILPDAYEFWGEDIEIQKATDYNPQPDKLTISTKKYDDAND